MDVNTFTGVPVTVMFGVKVKGLVGEKDNSDYCAWGSNDNMESRERREGSRDWEHQREYDKGRPC